MPRAFCRVESPLSANAPALELPDLPARTTARELIRTRVREEVARHNFDPSRPYSGLVVPTPAERELNAHAGRRERPAADGARQAGLAEKAFAEQRFVLIVGDRQIESLDEEVDLSGGPEVIFVQLVPLAGG